jgi:hypothetical protein
MNYTIGSSYLNYCLANLKFIHNPVITYLTPGCLMLQCTKCLVYCKMWTNVKTGVQGKGHVAGIFSTQFILYHYVVWSFTFKTFFFKCLLLLPQATETWVSKGLRLVRRGESPRDSDYTG